MGSRIPAGLVRAALALVTLTSAALAGGRNPGSLLIFPEFDNLGGRVSLLTITNTNADIADGSIYVEVVWLDGTPGAPLRCAETNQTYRLTPNDTLTLYSAFENPNAQRGFAYAFAKDFQGRAVAFDWLIGDTLFLDPVLALDYAISPIPFTSPRPQKQPTDVDGDGLRDLDGVEYEAAPDRVLVPRFLGQGPLATSELILIGLTGGSQFTTIVDFLVYNDNEEVFSRSYAFQCWTKVPLMTISSLFGQQFLAQQTNHAPNEIVGYPLQESGWFEINGNRAWSTATQFLDPAVLAVLVESSSVFESSSPRRGAETAFSLGTQTNGALLPNGILGDQD
ncbi:MAG: hypothetical protein JNK02_05995 [Planctomycetes bacterium]|nr:hypothetical protein [Planctomycetota bacterium]